MLNAARVLRLCSIVLSIGVAAQVLAATHDAGTTPGSFDVDQSGAASYSIPIQVPPGIGGVQPSLSLNYSSQGGNGLLGMGWSLGGLSAITRCPTNLYDDGYIHGVDYSAQDKFCLDGQRLVAISGAYGASGTEYRTQNESYSKIISYGTVGTGPAYFVVRTKSGQMMEYGNTVDSFVEAQGKTTALMWAVNKISDMTGNYIKFSYTDNSFATGEHYINRIDYTGNATTGLAPYFSVCFVYDNDPNTSPANCTNAGTAIRSDIITQYESGSITKVTHRLSHIQTIVGINKIKEYRLTYDSSGAVNNSHLISVTDCGSDGVCISPTTFTWSQTTTGFDPPQMLLTSNGGVNGSPTSYLPGYMFVADFNGDGRADYMWNYGGWQVATTTGELPDLLVKTTNGLGDTTSVSYKPLTDSTVYQIKVGTETCVDTYPIPCVQASIQVVSSYAKDNGKGGQYLHNYFYTGLKAHSRGRGVLGFHDIIITDPQTGVQIQTVYHQYDAARLETDPLKYTLSGRVDTQTTYKGGSLLAVTDNTWTPKLSPLYAGVSLVELSRADEYSYELNIPGNLAITHTTTTTTFDNDGNATSIVVNSNDGYVKTTTNTYPPADYVNWILGRLTSASVLSQTPTQSQTRSSSFTYFSNGLLQSETIQPGNAALAQTTTYVYDSYGNKSSVTVSGNAGSADPTYSTFAPVSYTTSNAYNYANLSVDGTYTVATTNPKLHTETKTIDARFGVPIKRVGPNGLATTWSYDALGRAIHETRADTSYTQTDYVICELAAACADPLMNTLHSPMKVVRTESTGATGSVYYDTLGREILKSTVGFDGRSVYVATEYDSLGHVLRVSNPVFDTALLNTLPVDACSPTHLLSLWTQNGYDAIGRMRCEYHPDGSHTEVHYLGLQTDTVNDKGQTGSKFKNSQGQLVQSTDATGHYNSYSYDAFGNLLSVTDAAGNTTSMSYDIRGNKIGMVDPDMGNWAYRYDAFGQLRWQQDAKAQIVTMDYDNLGRMFTRTELEGTTSWTYDTAINGKGKLQQVTGPGGYKQVFTYDALGRASTVATTIKGNTYSVASSYLAGSSLVDTVTYPYSLVIQNLYNGRGQLAAVKRSGVANACTSNANYEYWRANAVNAAGQVIKETLCNNITTVRLYDDYTGRVEGISSGVGASTAVQNLTFDYDTLGNLITRKDNNKAYAEAFQYDTLNRLTRSDLTTPTLVKTTTYQYDAIGNIQYKSDVGSYLYSKINAGPHAVTTAGTATYSYDKNGNQAAGDGRTLTYTSFNKPKTVVRGATTENVEYGAAHERVYKNTVVSTASTRTYYLGAFEEVILPSGISERKYYIAAGGTTVLITNRSNSLNDTRYLHKDHLGSTDAITTETGALLTDSSGKVQCNSFDAFGQRRMCDWSAVGVGQAAYTYVTIGFTGHSMDDEVALIDMNARMYDPKLGRFLQPDTYIQFPDHTQGFNRYAYVNNNPLSYTDPSGHWSLGGLFDSVTILVHKIGQEASNAAKKYGMGVMLFGASNGMFMYSAPVKNFMLDHAWARQVGTIVAVGYGAASAAVWSAYLTDISGGSFSDIVKSALVSYVSASLNAKVSGSWYTQAFERGLIAGSTASVLGGDFKKGFTMAFVASVGKSLLDSTARAGMSDKDQGYESGFGRATKGATYKPNADKAADDPLNYGSYSKAMCGASMSVCDATAANTGSGVDAPSMFDIGRTVTSTAQGMKYENSGFMQFLAKDIPGVQAFSNLHDVHMGLLQQAMNNSYGFGSLNIATIPVYAYVQYRALGADALHYQNELMTKR